MDKLRDHISAFIWCTTDHAGPPGIPVLKTQNSPRQRKNSRKFPFGNMLDFARSNTISSQIGDIYLNQLQWYGQFAEVYMLLEVLSLEIYPNVTNSFPSVQHVETDRQRSITVVSTNGPPSGQTSPGHCLPLKHLPLIRTPSIPGRWMQNLGLKISASSFV